MAPTEVSSNAAKRAGKANSKCSGDGKKINKKRKGGYFIYIYKVMKQVHPDTSISSKAMSRQNRFLFKLFGGIALIANRLNHFSKRSTIANSEVQSVVRLFLPGKLTKHGVSEIIKAVTKYTSAK